MSAACFVRDLTGGQWVNLLRAVSIRVAPDSRSPGQWVVLAHFSGRTVVIARADTEEDADHRAEQLAARANAGARS